MDLISESHLNDFSKDHCLTSLSEDQRFENFATYVMKGGCVICFHVGLLMKTGVRRFSTPRAAELAAWVCSLLAKDRTAFEPTHRSAVVPSAFDNRTIISALTAALSFNTAESACRVTPSPAATSIGVKGGSVNCFEKNNAGPFLLRDTALSNGRPAISICASCVKSSSRMR